VGFRSKELQCEKLSSRPIFRADKTPKILFLGLSLLPNPTEMLAMQATVLFIDSCIGVYIQVSLSYDECRKFRGHKRSIRLA